MRLLKTSISLSVSAAALAAASFAAPAPAHAQEAYLGEVKLFGTNWCPRGFAAANGQLLAISQNTALFSLLGTVYGGDGRTTFALPDLRGRVPISYGRGPGLSMYSIGERGGSEQHTLNVSQMPSHNHTALLRGESQTIADSGNISGNVLARTTSQIYSDESVPNASAALHADSIAVGNTGGSQSFSIVQPYLAMNYCIATQGIYPSRN